MSFEHITPARMVACQRMVYETGLETNARPLARGELNSVRASGSSDLTSPVGEWIFFCYYYYLKRDDKLFKFYDVMG